MNLNQATQSYSGSTTIDVCGNCRQKLRISQSHAWIRATCPTCRHEFNYRFVDHAAPVTRLSSRDSVSGAVLAVLGLIFVIGGVVIFIGNLSGIFPTFPYAGFITSRFGLAVMGAAMKA